MEKRFYLSDTDKRLGGVCGGLAEYFGIDSLIIRIIFVVLVLGYGTGILAYILLWLLAPKHNAIR
jgi:phage shock protein PspC (stress-responsive transcriptional regulator)